MMANSYIPPSGGMFTHRYKDGYIHGHCDRDECKAQMKDGRMLGRYRSYRAAQLAITGAMRPTT